MLRIKAYSASGAYLDTIAFGLDSLGLKDCLNSAAAFFAKHAGHDDTLADIMGLPELPEQSDVFLRFVEAFITPEAGFPDERIRELIDEVKGRVVLDTLRNL